MAKKKNQQTKKTGTSTTGTPTRAGSVAPDASAAATGTTTPAPVTPQSGSKLPPLVGINFGNSYASIAVLSKEGQAECIANEDGERQIACAIAFHGAQVYIGNEARHQLVKNAQNTILGFRNLLGKSFSQIDQSKPAPIPSAPVIQHPTEPDTPAYKVTYTPEGSEEPLEKYLTPKEATTIFLQSLLGSASAFLGVPISGAVISVPEWFSPEARAALESSAKDAGVQVLQLLEEAGAVVSVTTSPTWGTENAGATSDKDKVEKAAGLAELTSDRTTLVVDLGSTSLTTTVLSIRQGLAYILASSHTTAVSASQIDERLIKFFATEFTKKTKVPLTVCPASEGADKRAEAKLRLAIEHTKRTVSASPGAATCSAEALKDGVDFSGSVNRMRFDMLASPVYADVAATISSLLSSINLDPHEVDEVVYVGGTTALPGLDERVCVQVGLREDVQTPFVRSGAGSALSTAAPTNNIAVSLASGGLGDPTSLVARGCALQAALISTLDLSSQTSVADAELKAAFTEKGHSAARATTSSIGVVFPGQERKGGEEGAGGVWVPVIPHETALPVRRIVQVEVEVADEVVLEVWEANEGIRVEKVVVPREVDEDEEEEEEEEEEEIKHRTLDKKTLLGVVRLTPSIATTYSAPLPVKKGAKSPRHDPRKQIGKKYTTLEITGIVSLLGAVELRVKEVGAGGKVGAAASVSVAGAN